MSFNPNIAAKSLLAASGLKTGLPVSSIVSFGSAHPRTGALTSYVNSNGIETPAPGTGGAVTQITSSSTGVTLSTESGQITTVALTTAGAAEEIFTVTNTLVDATDVIVTATTYNGQGTPAVTVKAVASGSFQIVITNLSASALNALLVVNFKVLKTAIA